MRELVVRRGYPAASIKELTATAKISRTSFYAHYTGKEDCFARAYDGAAARVLRTATAVGRRRRAWDVRLSALLDAFVTGMVSDPLAAHFLLVSALSAGDDALDRRDRLADALVRRLQALYGAAPDGVAMPAVLARAIFGGVTGVAAARLRRERQETLSDDAGDLLAWASAYRHPEAARLPSPPKALRPRLELEVARAPGTGDQRERIVRAVAEVVADLGYNNVTIPEICWTAGVSHQTFYALFPDKANALQAGYQEMGKALVARLSDVFASARAGRSEWPAAVHAALAALADFFAAEPAYARVVFVESLVAGADAADVRDQYTALTLELLLPSGSDAPAVPDVVREAVAGAIFELVHHEVRGERVAQLPELVPHLTYVALAPFIGAEPAIAVALS